MVNDFVIVWCISLVTSYRIRSIPNCIIYMLEQVFDDGRGFNKKFNSELYICRNISSIWNFNDNCLIETDKITRVVAHSFIDLKNS